MVGSTHVTKLGNEKTYMGKDSPAYVISVLSPENCCFSRKLLLIICYSILQAVDERVESCSTAGNAIFIIFVFK